MHFIDSFYDVSDFYIGSFNVVFVRLTEYERKYLVHMQIFKETYLLLNI